jgi:uncharacterized protein YjbI with pentapeptide repeats
MLFPGVIFNLRNANLSGVNFSGLNLSGCDFEAANLSNANLSMADLFNADLTSCDLTGADLSKANLKCRTHELSVEICALGTRLPMNLRRCNFSGTDWRDFSGFNISNAIFDGVDPNTVTSNKCIQLKFPKS